MRERESADRLESRWESYLKNHGVEGIRRFLSDNSNLPGPRANITLARTLSELMSRDWETDNSFMKDCLDDWSQGNDEYLRFCRNFVLGYIMAEYPEEWPWATRLLYEDNFNNLWRPREAVTLGVAEALRRRTTLTLSLLDDWNRNEDLVVLRNTLMILADPEVLPKSRETRDALRGYTVKAMKIVKDHSTPMPNGLSLLKKTLRFTISVGAVHDPSMMEKLEEWVDSGAREWRSILKSNLKKNRLTKRHPEKTRELLSRLEQAVT